MVSPTIPVNESERLRVLDRYAILDTLPERDYDDIVQIAAEICQTPMSTISLIDKDRQWFKAQVGMTDKSTPREFAFCAHAINDPYSPLIVPDSTKDIRFIGNPYVDGDPHVKFYAGVPLVSDEGFALGTLCILDDKPREITERQLASLKALANQVVNILELRKKNIELERSKRDLNDRYKELEEFSYVVSHDIKSPVNNILSITQILREDYGTAFDEDGNIYINHLDESAIRLKQLIDGIVAHYRGSQLEDEIEEMEVGILLQEIVSMVDAKQETQFSYPKSAALIRGNKIALQQILLNLIVNAIKYNDKRLCIVEFDFAQSASHYYFTVKDNGMGIGEEDLPKIFDLFTHLNKTDRDGNMGTGIGLSTVKKLIEKMGGEIKVKSELGKGSVFTFTVLK